MPNILYSPLRQWGSALALASGLLSGAPAQATPPPANAASAASAASATAWPGNSVYQLNATLTDQDGKSFAWQRHSGKPVLLSMFYSSCKFVCPMLIDTMALTQAALSPAQRAQLDLLLITFDPARDDVSKLHGVAQAHGLDTQQWTLARTDSSSVRKIAATLGIQYRLLADGEFNHTTMLVLLDGAGRIVATTRKMGSADPAFVQQLKQTLDAARPSAP